MKSISKELEIKYNRLKSELTGFRRLLVAYSGGVDSVLLLKVVSDVLGKNALGVIGVSPSLAKRELAEAQKIAEDFNLSYIMLQTREIEDENYASNPADRCYFCKKILFGEIYDYAREHGYSHIADGTNLDDVGDFRPGRQAAAEMKVVSPLKDAGFTKQDVRDLSRHLELPTWNKPALACLSSRIPAGTRVTLESLNRIERAEDYLQLLGFRVFRVRHHDNLARIEVAPHEISRFLDVEIRQKIHDEFKKIGYTFITLDLMGYRQGSMNELIDVNEVRKV